ncbi:MAG: carboxymethylenebutenolidase, partial [Pseudomonadota bacterium]
MKLMDYGLEPIDFNHPATTAGKADAGLSRRGFVMTSLASGFAIASNPVLAQAVTTDSKGLVAGEVSITVADGKVPAYRAMPAGPGKFPVMLVVQEI